ncbi:MAG: hypothetical protein ACW986_08050 [Promethearchaeota archaeon]
MGEWIIEHQKTLRVVAGVLCILVAILRILTFFIDLSGAVIYSAVFIDPNEAVNILQGFFIVLFAVLFTIFTMVIAVIIYIVLGVLQIVLRRIKTISIICNIISGLSIILSIRAVIIYATNNEFSILLISLLAIYIAIFSLCILSYIKLRKEK